MGSSIWFDIEKPIEVYTPLSRMVSNTAIERVERYAENTGVRMVIALGSDAAVLFGREEDVMDTIRFATEKFPCMFHTLTGEA
jgi:hypothetical protein